MIISISGPSSTGKSTLISALKEYYGDGCVIMSEVIRESLAEMLKTYGSLNGIYEDKDATLKSIEKLCDDYCNSVLKLPYLDSKPIIMDRCHIDGIVYALINTLPFDGCDEVVSKVVTRYLSTPIEFDKVYFTVPSDDDKIEDDGFRSMQLLHRRPLEVNLFKMYHTQRNAVVLPDGVYKRVHLIVSDIEKYEASHRAKLNSTKLIKNTLLG